MRAAETFLDGKVTLYCGDNLAVLPTLAANSIDSCLTDPPYGLGFMGKYWDHGVPGVRYWKEILHVLKPGAYLLSFGGTRTFGRMQCAIEEAGFEIRDSIFDLFTLDPEVIRFVESLSDTQLAAFIRIIDLIGFTGLLMWVYGSGFPKSHDVSKAIDRAAGGEREKTGTKKITGRNGDAFGYGPEQHQTRFAAGDIAITAPATDAAREWDGWGTALKPACEPIVLARKPLSESTVAANVLKWGTGALNIDGCRVGTTKDVPASASKTPNNIYGAGMTSLTGGTDNSGFNPNIGRWPANIIHDGSDEVVRAFPDAPGQQRSTGPEFDRRANVYGKFAGVTAAEPRGDSGSAARFFYTAKADADDRLGSKHPTVKPLDLMQYLARLITPPGGLVLDPFAGTGTTGEAAWREGMRAILIEREEEYQDDIRRRMKLCLAGPDERARESIKARHKDKPIEHGPLFGGGT